MTRLDGPRVRAPVARGGRLPPSLLLLPAALAAALVLANLLRWPLWGDEFYTLEMSEYSAQQFYDRVKMDFHPPGYYLTARAARVFGEGWGWIRLPSLLGVVGAVLLAGRAGQRHLGGAVGLGAAVILALHEFPLTYGACARSYGPMIFLGAVLAWSSLGLASDRRAGRRHLVGLGLAAALGMYTHFLMAVPIATAALGLLAAELWRPGRPLAARGRALARALGALALGGLAFLPWLLFGPVAQQVGRQGQGGLNPDVFRYLLFHLGGSFTVASAVVVLLAALGGLAALRRALRGEAVGGALCGWLLAGLLLPLAASRDPSAALKTYAYAGMLPFLAILAGQGAAALAGRLSGGRAWLGPALLALLLVPQAADIVRLPSAPFARELRGGGYHRLDLEARVIDEGVVSDTVLVQGTLLGHFYAYTRLPQARSIPSGPSVVTRDRTEDARDTYDMPDRCVFPEAFPGLVTVWPPESCAGVLAGIEAEAAGHAPFLLELADLALAEGEAARAEALALEARSRHHSSSRPDLFLARLHARQGRPEAVLAAVEAALPRAVRWGNDADLDALYTLAEAAHEARGEVYPAREAGIRARCVDRGVLPVLCVTLPISRLEARDKPRGRKQEGVIPLGPGGAPSVGRPG